MEQLYPKDYLSTAILFPEKEFVVVIVGKNKRVIIAVNDKILKPLEYLKMNGVKKTVESFGGGVFAMAHFKNGKLVKQWYAGDDDWEYVSDEGILG